MKLESIAPQFIESFNNHSRAFIQIQNGCDHRCTFCTIPFGRGNSRSLPIEKIVEQINILNEIYLIIYYNVKFFTIEVKFFFV